jgi:hypothetical protein
MFRRTALAILIALSLGLSGVANAADVLSHAQKVTCKIMAGPNAVLTGIVIAQDKDFVYTITAGHGWQGPTGMQCFTRFYHNGYQSAPLKSTLIFKSYNPVSTDDLAMVRTPVSEFEDYPLPEEVVKLAGEDYRVKDGDKLITYGCPEGKWPRGIVGHATKTFKKDRIRFLPAPEGGQSGSGIFNKDGELVGMILWQSGEASSHHKIRDIRSGWLKKMVENIIKSVKSDE